MREAEEISCLTAGDDSSPCQATVCKCSSDVCYLRLEFSTFSTSSPMTTTYTNTNPNGRGQCQTSQFSVSSDGVETPVICGTNTGYHMIVNAEVSSPVMKDSTVES